MTLQELLQQADDQISYPFEDIIERYLPFADSITDHVCVCVIVLEDVFSGKGLGPEKKEALMVGLRALWVGIPILVFLRPILDPIFETAMSALIDTVVNWINGLFPGETRGEAWTGLAEQTQGIPLGE